jgi:hypothetical protein
LHTAEIAEVLYTDTFESGDLRFPYGQAFIDHASRWGDVIPLRSRKEVGSAFVTFVCRHYTPLILISDNISENKGGALAEECRLRSVRQAFTCPYHPQQDRAEGYLGRITAMASFGMVFSGAPLFMWIWAVRTAVFLNNITASYFSRERVWVTPYELIRGEPFPDASIVVPFGCAALILLDQKDLTKFGNRCALMVFVHYADEHPLYTYAFYSPLAKRVLFRQDCIFLPAVFPMRAARHAAGLSPDGEQLIPYRSPPCMRGNSDLSYSFLDWSASDPLPTFEDHVSGVNLSRPLSGDVMLPPSHGLTKFDNNATTGKFPYHPAFGETSVVRVRIPPSLNGNGSVGMPALDAGPESELPEESIPSDSGGLSAVSNLPGCPPLFRLFNGERRSGSFTTTTGANPTYDTGPEGKKTRVRCESRVFEISQTWLTLQGLFWYVSPIVLPPGCFADFGMRGSPDSYVRERL